MEQKKILFLMGILALFSVIQSAHAQVKNKSNTVNVKVHLKGLPAGQKLYYGSDPEFDNNGKRDSILTDTGGFNLNIDIPTGQGQQYTFQLGLLNIPEKRIQLYLESGNWELTSKTNRLNDDKMVISGKPYADDINSYKEYLLRTLTELGAKGGVGAVMAGVVPAMQQWIIKNPQSPIAVSTLYVANKQGMITDEDARKIVKKMKKTALNNVPGRALLISLKAAKENK